MNKLRDGDIKKIVEVFNNFSTIDKYSTITDLVDIKENDWNLNITRYVDPFSEPESIEIPDILEKLRLLEEERKTIEEKLKEYLRVIGYDY